MLDPTTGTPQLPPFQALPTSNTPMHTGVPTPTAPTGGGDSSGGGWSMPSVDYSGLLAQMLGPLRSQASAASAADKAAMLAAQKRAIIQFGAPLSASDLSLLKGDFGNAMDSKTLGLAQQNTSAGLSVLARLNEAHADAVRNIRNTLAARGILRSGESGYQSGREQTASTRAQYDARQKVLDYLSGLQTAFTQAEQQRQWALAQAAMSAAASLPQGVPVWSGGSTPPSAPAQPSGPVDYNSRFHWGL